MGVFVNQIDKNCQWIGNCRKSLNSAIQYVSVWDRNE